MVDGPRVDVGTLCSLGHGARCHVSLRMTAPVMMCDSNTHVDQLSEESFWVTGLVGHPVVRIASSLLTAL